MSPVVLLGISLAGLTALVSFIRLMTDPRAAWLLLVLMIFSAGLAVQVDRAGNTANITWLQPLQLQRANLYIGFGSLLFLGMLVHMNKLRLNTIPMQGLLLMSIQFVAGMLRFVHETPFDAISTIASAFLTMLPIMLLLPYALNQWDDWTKMIRIFGFAALVWGGAVAVQVVLDHRQLITGWQSRFTGMLGNPQGCGLFMAPLVLSLLWLILNETNAKLRWLWIFTFGMMGVYCMWTGSRTCILVIGLGSMFVLYSRMGRAILLLPVAAVGLYALFLLASALGLSTDAIDRLGSKQNTREVVWTLLYEDALQNPILGSGFRGTRANENSYLVSFGAYGILGGGLVLALTFYSGFLMLKVFRARAFLPAGRKQIADLILGFNAVFFAGAMFEWYIIARLEGMLPYMLIFSVMTKRLLDRVEQGNTLDDAVDVPQADWRDEYQDAIADYGEEPKDQRIIA